MNSSTTPKTILSQNPNSSIGEDPNDNPNPNLKINSNFESQWTPCHSRLHREINNNSIDTSNYDNHTLTHTNNNNTNTNTTVTFNSTTTSIPLSTTLNPINLTREFLEL